MTGRTRILALAIGSLLTVAGCTSSAGSTTGTTDHSTASSTAPFSTHYGQDASLIASHINGCADVTAADIGNGASTGMVGKATCTMRGHQVVIYTWKDAASQDASDALVAGSLDYFASGAGWDQILGDDAAADAQKVIAKMVAKALNGTVRS